MHHESLVSTLGALTGNQDVQQVKAGLQATYLSGWQVAADVNHGGQMYPDQSLYPANTEDAKGKPTGLPLELLRQLIVASDQVRQEFLMWYLKSAFDAYQKVQDAVENRLTEVGSAILSPMNVVKRFMGAANTKQPDSESEAEIDALCQRITELESRIEKGAREKRRSPSKRK